MALAVVRCDPLLFDLTLFDLTWMAPDLACGGQQQLIGGRSLCNTPFESGTEGSVSTDYGDFRRFKMLPAKQSAKNCGFDRARAAADSSREGQWAETLSTHGERGGRGRTPCGR